MVEIATPTGLWPVPDRATQPCWGWSLWTRLTQGGSFLATLGLWAGILLGFASHASELYAMLSPAGEGHGLEMRFDIFVPLKQQNIFFVHPPRSRVSKWRSSSSRSACVPMREKFLRQIARFLRAVSEPAEVGVNGRPAGAAKRFERRQRLGAR